VARVPRRQLTPSKLKSQRHRQLLGRTGRWFESRRSSRDGRPLPFRGLAGSGCWPGSLKNRLLRGRDTPTAYFNLSPATAPQNWPSIL